jgi:hypothetical protein
MYGGEELGREEMKDARIQEENDRWDQGSRVRDGPHAMSEKRHPSR